MSTTKKNNQYEEDEMQKYIDANNSMNSHGLTGVDTKLSGYEKKYGGNLYNVDQNQFTDATQLKQFLTDRQDYGTLTSYRDAYNTSLQSAQKAQAEKEAYARNRQTLMEKYIPETLLAQGFKGNALAADSLLRMNNNYTNYVLGSMNEKQQAEANALQDYQTALKEYTIQKDAKALEDLANTEAEQTSLVNTYKEQITENPSVELAADIKSAKEEGLITESQYNEIMGVYSKNKESEGILKGTVPLKAQDGKEYYLGANIGNLKNNSELLKKVKELGYLDVYDINIPNGTTFRVPVSGPGHSVVTLLTYYNGKWYTSRQKK